MKIVIYNEKQAYMNTLMEKYFTQISYNKPINYKEPIRYNFEQYYFPKK